MSRATEAFFSSRYQRSGQKRYSMDTTALPLSYRDAVCSPPPPSHRRSLVNRSDMYFSPGEKEMLWLRGAPQALMASSRPLEAAYYNREFHPFASSPSVFLAFPHQHELQDAALRFQPYVFPPPSFPSFQQLTQTPNLLASSYGSMHHYRNPRRAGTTSFLTSNNQHKSKARVLFTSGSIINAHASPVGTTMTMTERTLPLSQPTLTTPMSAACAIVPTPADTISKSEICHGCGLASASLRRCASDVFVLDPLPLRPNVLITNKVQKQHSTCVPCERKCDNCKGSCCTQCTTRCGSCGDVLCSNCANRCFGRNCGRWCCSDKEGRDGRLPCDERDCTECKKNPVCGACVQICSGPSCSKKQMCDQCVHSCEDCDDVTQSFCAECVRYCSVCGVRYQCATCSVNSFAVCKHCKQISEERMLRNHSRYSTPRQQQELEEPANSDGNCSTSTTSKTCEKHDAWSGIAAVDMAAVDAHCGPQPPSPCFSPTSSSIDTLLRNDRAALEMFKQLDADFAAEQRAKFMTEAPKRLSHKSTCDHETDLTRSVGDHQTSRQDLHHTDILLQNFACGTSWGPEVAEWVDILTDEKAATANSASQTILRLPLPPPVPRLPVITSSAKTR